MRKGGPFNLSSHRLDPLIDGIFAVALTVLVLEVKVPELKNPSSARELLDAVGASLPLVIAYFVSFALLGMFWVWHHGLKDKIKRIDGALLFCTLTFLALVCFFPFAAAVFGRYMIYGNVVCLLVYLPLVGLILALQLLYFYLAMRRGLILDEVTPQEAMTTHRRNLYSLAIFLFSCTPAALIVGLSLALICFVCGGLLVYAGIRHRSR
ncbi:TMEM175 family protein [Massilia sp. 9I]|uniref:TMEM175 family protein n=1 Tax=Massilia sp. 9I TaxID=2653152 RepID=UPI0012F2C855|nr:TMEM175 family protein [Massilia sp. 9I]VXB31749.1 Putative membrane protein [Massilia sp. 9I]